VAIPLPFTARTGSPPAARRLALPRSCHEHILSSALASPPLPVHVELIKSTVEDVDDVRDFLIDQVGVSGEVSLWQGGLSVSENVRFAHQRAPPWATLGHQRRLKHDIPICRYFAGGYHNVPAEPVRVNCRGLGSGKFGAIREVGNLPAYHIQSSHTFNLQLCTYSVVFPRFESQLLHACKLLYRTKRPDLTTLV